MLISSGKKMAYVFKICPFKSDVLFFLLEKERLQKKKIVYLYTFMIGI